MRQIHTFETSYESKQTNSLTPKSRIIRKKLTGSQLVKKFPAFYGTGKFLTAFTSVRHLCLS